MGTPRRYKRDSLDLQAVFFPTNKPLEPHCESADEKSDEDADEYEEDDEPRESTPPVEISKSDSRESSHGSLFSEDIDSTSHAHCSGTTWADFSMLKDSGIFSLEKSSRMMLSQALMLKAMDDSKLQSTATFPHWYDSAILDNGHQSTSVPDNSGRRSSQSMSRSSNSVSRLSTVSRLNDSKLASVLEFTELNDSAISDMETSGYFHLQGSSYWRTPSHDLANATVPCRRSSSQSSSNPSLSSSSRSDSERTEGWIHASKIASVLSCSHWNDSDISSLDASHYFHLQGPSSWVGVSKPDETATNAAMPDRRSSGVYRPSQFIPSRAIPENSSFNNSSSEATETIASHHQTGSSTIITTPASESPRYPSRRKSIGSPVDALESEDSNPADNDSTENRYFL